jgi:hypothetical protein
MLKTFYTFSLLLVFSSVKSQTQKVDVYFFLLEECLICQDYMPKIKELAVLYKEVGDFHIVFPHEVSRDSSIKDFLISYGLNLPYRIDYHQQFAKKFGITITPEVAVVSKLDERLIYRGRIDNQFVEIGKRRRVPTTDDLNLVLKNASKTITIYPFTKAVGCLINFDN